MPEARRPERGFEMSYQARTIYCDLVLSSDKVGEAARLVGAKDGIRDWLGEIGFETKPFPDGKGVSFDWGVTYHGEQMDLVKIQNCLVPWRKAVWINEDDQIWKQYVVEVETECGSECRLVTEALDPSEF